MYVNCSTGQSELSSVLDKIEAELRALKVVGSFDRVSLQEKIEAASANGESDYEGMIACGIDPVPQRDATLEWAGDFFSEGFVLDAKTGQVNYRQRASHPSVEEGALLATRLSGVEGKPGVDVFGNAVPVPPFHDAMPRLGTHVRDEEKDGKHYYYATAGGRVRWIKNTISVDTVLTISGDVGIKTGDIVHQGAVIIQGSVLAGSKIQAGGDLEVRGSVEPADMVVGGNLTVWGGIIGAVGRKTIVAGAVCAKYVIEAEVEAGGDLVIEREAILSHLKTQGHLHMPQGRLVGGEVIALQGVDVKEAGNIYNVPTCVTAGEDFCLVREVAAKKSEIAHQQACLDQTHDIVAILTVREKTLTPQQRETLTEKFYEESTLREELGALRLELKELTVSAKKHSASRVIARVKIYSEVTICLENLKLVTVEEWNGPVRAVSASSGIYLHPMKQEDFRQRAHHPAGPMAAA